MGCDEGDGASQADPGARSPACAGARIDGCAGSAGGARRRPRGRRVAGDRGFYRLLGRDLLASAIGPITVGTGPDLLPTLNSAGHGFATTGSHNFELLGITSLTFTSSLQSVPEPLSMDLLAIGLTVQIGFLGARRKRGSIEETTGA